MNHTAYLKLDQITELTHKDVILKDVVQVYCGDQNVINKCNSMKVMIVKVDAERCYIMSALNVTNKLKQPDSTIDVNNMGETGFITAYESPSPPAYIQQWTKTIFAYLVRFFGAAFTAVTLNNDASVTDVLSEVFRLVMGYESGGFTVLEVSHSVGLAMSIIGPLNHFAAIELDTDPTPLEMEVRLYKDNISKTLIANDSKKKSKVDII